jgi:hypothetical protein
LEIEYEPYRATRSPRSEVSDHDHFTDARAWASRAEPDPVAIEVDEDSAPYAVAGQNVTLYLSGIDPKHLAIGTVLCPTSLPVPLVTQFTAQILVFDLQSPIIAGTPVSGASMTDSSSLLPSRYRRHPSPISATLRPRGVLIRHIA